jgi:AcrR family transcriptional regulator
MTKLTARERLAEAAFTLFDEDGYERTTVDDITERAGLGRTTFFRHYRSKDDVIFPDHDLLIEQIALRLRTSSHATALAAVSDAVRLVLLHYINEGELARRRYALTSRVPALRDREIASVARYQRLFREFIAGWMADTAEPAPLRAELMAAAVVAAHNHVLRRWLRGESPDPMKEVDEALRLAIGLFTESADVPAEASADGGTTVLAFRTGQDLDTLVTALRQIVGEQGENTLALGKKDLGTAALGTRSGLGADAVDEVHGLVGAQRLGRQPVHEVPVLPDLVGRLHVRGAREVLRVDDVGDQLAGEAQDREGNAGRARLAR